MRPNLNSLGGGTAKRLRIAQQVHLWIANNTQVSLQTDKKMKPENLCLPETSIQTLLRPTIGRLLYVYSHVNRLHKKKTQKKNNAAVARGGGGGGCGGGGRLKAVTQT